MSNLRLHARKYFLCTASKEQIIWKKEFGVPLWNIDKDRDKMFPPLTMTLASTDIII